MPAILTHHRNIALYALFSLEMLSRRERMSDGGGGSALADVLIGAAAGAAAVWAMDRVDWFNFRREASEARQRTQAIRPGGMDPAHVIADTAARSLGQELKPREENGGGKTVHYALGTISGALYGTLRHRVPAVTAGGGTLFGLGMFFLQDEGLNAMLGLSAKPRRYPWQTHARGFVAHAVYGLVLNAALKRSDHLRRR